MRAAPRAYSGASARGGLHAVGCGTPHVPRSPARSLRPLIALDTFVAARCAALGRPAAAQLRTFVYSGGPLKRCIGSPSHLRAGHVGSPPPRIERGVRLMGTRHRRTVRSSLSPSRAAVSRYGSRLAAAHSPGGCPDLLVKRVAEGHAYRGGCPGPCSEGARIARVVSPLKVCAVRALSAIL